MKVNKTGKNLNVTNFYLCLSNMNTFTVKELKSRNFKNSRE